MEAGTGRHYHEWSARCNKRQNLCRCDMAGQEFTMIDTGGIEPDSSDIILSQMRESRRRSPLTQQMLSSWPVSFLFVNDKGQFLMNGGWIWLQFKGTSLKFIVRGRNKWRQLGLSCIWVHVFQTAYVVEEDALDQIAELNNARNEPIPFCLLMIKWIKSLFSLKILDQNCNSILMS